MINFANTIVWLLIKAPTQIISKAKITEVIENMQYAPFESLLDLCVFFTQIIKMHLFQSLSNSKFS